MSIGWPSLLRNQSNEASHIWQTILIFNCIYLMNILRPLPSRLEHLYLFGPSRAKHLTIDLFFLNYETVLYFFLNCYNKRNLLVWLLTTLKQLLNLTPVQTSCDSQASSIRCDPAAIWNSDPWTHAYQHNNIMKLSNLLLLLSRLKFASVKVPTDSVFSFLIHICDLWWAYITDLYALGRKRSLR